MSVRNTSSSIYCGYIDAQKWSIVSVNNDEDMTSMYTAKHGEWREDEGDQQGFPSREEGPKLIRFISPRWRPKNNSSSSPPRSSRAARTKNDAQVAYGVCFRRSLYG